MLRLAENARPRREQRRGVVHSLADGGHVVLGFGQGRDHVLDDLVHFAHALELGFELCVARFGGVLDGAGVTAGVLLGGGGLRVGRVFLRRRAGLGAGEEVFNVLVFERKLLHARGGGWLVHGARNTAAERV